MRVIPVLDVRRGRAVHAVAGDRAHYGPLRSVLHPGSDPIKIARAARDGWSLPDLYLADLDAILGEAPPNFGLLSAIADLGLTQWVDAGVRQAADAGPLLEAGVGHLIVGLETIAGPDELARLLAEVGPDPIVFSLDLRRGRPLVDTRTAWGTDTPAEIAARVIECGVRRLIHLDLARVGTGRGVEIPEAIGSPGVEWIVGGGISGVEEIRELGRSGIQGVLVGSALHDGRITAADLRAINPLGRSSDVSGRRPS